MTKNAISLAEFTDLPEELQFEVLHEPEEVRRPPSALEQLEDCVFELCVLIEINVLQTRKGFDGEGSAVIGLGGERE